MWTHQLSVTCSLTGVSIHQPMPHIHQLNLQLWQSPPSTAAAVCVCVSVNYLMSQIKSLALIPTDQHLLCCRESLILKSFEVLNVLKVQRAAQRLCWCFTVVTTRTTDFLFSVGWILTVSACVISPRIKVKVGFTSETWSVVSEKNPGTKSPWTVGSETPLLIPVTFWLVRVRGYGQLVRVRG